MNKKRQLTELTLWLAALAAAIVLTGSDGWHASRSVRSPAAPGAETALLR